MRRAITASEARALVAYRDGSNRLFGGAPTLLAIPRASLDPQNLFKQLSLSLHSASKSRSIQSEAGSLIPLDHKLKTTVRIGGEDKYMIAPALQSDWILPRAAKEKPIARRENGVVARRASLIDALVHRTLLSRECLTAAGSDPLDERPDGFHYETWLFHMNIVTALGYDVRPLDSACEELAL